MSERPWWTRVAEGTRAMRRYRVVYRAGGREHPLGRIELAAPTRASLDPFRSRLRLEGLERGELLLFDERTGSVAVRRAVREPSTG